MQHAWQVSFDVGYVGPAACFAVVYFEGGSPGGRRNGGVEKGETDQVTMDTWYTGFAEVGSTEW